MRYILPLLLLLLSMNAKAQDYLPVLTEGKVWNCLYKDLSLSGNDPIKFQISVAGNAVVDNKNCKKLLFHYPGGERKDYTVNAYEEGKKLYAYYYDGGEAPTLLIDFNLKKGDERQDDEQWYKVLDVDSVTTGDNVKRLRLKIDGGSNTEKCTYWIEGVGATEDNWVTQVPRPTNGETKMLESCYDNGVCIFQNDKLPDYMKSGITSIRTTKAMDGKEYNLSGCAISGNRHAGVVIKNGKKILK